jgi:hypothetical protein
VYGFPGEANAVVLVDVHGNTGYHHPAGLQVDTSSYVYGMSSLDRAGTEDGLSEADAPYTVTWPTPMEMIQPYYTFHGAPKAAVQFDGDREAALYAVQGQGFAPDEYMVPTPLLPGDEDDYASVAPSPYYEFCIPLTGTTSETDTDDGDHLPIPLRPLSTTPIYYRLSNNQRRSAATTAADTLYAIPLTQQGPDDGAAGAYPPIPGML